MMNIYLARQTDLGKNDEIVASAANEANGSIVCTSVALFRFCGRFIRKKMKMSLQSPHMLWHTRLQEPVKRDGQQMQKRASSVFLLYRIS